MFLSFCTSNISVYKDKLLLSSCTFYTACTFCILKSFIAVLKGWALLFNACISLYTWLVEVFLLTEHQRESLCSSTGALTLSAQWTPTGNLLSGFYIALMFSFSLSHDHSSIRHGVITCLGPGCACAKENLWFHQSDLNYYRDTQSQTWEKNSFNIL